MLSIKDQIHKNIKLYMSLKPIIYTKSKNVDEKGNVSIKEEYVRASQHFNLKEATGKSFDDNAASNMIKETKQMLATELLDIVQIVLDENKLLETYQQRINTLMADLASHDKVFKFCLDIFIKTNVVSPYDTIDYELLKDNESSLYGAKQLIAIVDPDDIEQEEI